MVPLADPCGYLARMAKPLEEKLKVAQFVPQNALSILDVGCADGAVTCALAELFPQAQVTGIDLESYFLKSAQVRAEKYQISNVHFERVYLREMLARQGRFDTVLFVSVLHEFFSYGEGISSVLKALADARELLVKGGDIVIRDMILFDYAYKTDYQVAGMLEKIRRKAGMSQMLAGFEGHFGAISSLASLNHFLLKYIYPENWERECAEHYIPVTFERYTKAFELLGMEIIHQRSYLLPYLKGRWQADFGFTEDEMTDLRSTGFLVART